MAVSRINEAGLDVNQYGNRNLIINGKMEIAQRGTSSSSNGYQTVDRMFMNLSGGTATMSQEEATLGSEVDDQFQYWLKIDTTTGDNNCGLIYKVENVRALREGKATFSFYAKGTNPNGGSYTVGMQRLPAGSGGSTLDTPLNSTVTITSTWTRYTFTFDVPALANTVTETAGSQLYLYVLQPSGDASTNAWELNITGMQLEQGDTATDFEHRTFADELAKCQRYLYRIGGATYTRIGTGFSYNTTAHNTPVPLPVSMRAIPTLTTSDLSGGSTFAVYHANANLAAVSNIVVESGGTDPTHVLSINSTTSGLTQGDVGILVTNNNTSAFLQFDAEL